METIIAAATALVTAAVLTGPAPQQGPQWLTCATIDKGGYSVFADPTCPEFDKGSEDEVNPKK